MFPVRIGTDAHTDTRCHLPPSGHSSGPPSSLPIHAINGDGVTDGSSSATPHTTDARIAALTGGNAGVSGVHHSVSELMKPHLQMVCVLGLGEG